MPSSEEAEKAVLGGLIYDSTQYGKVSHFLKSEYFYHSINSRLYELIENMIKRDEPIDLVTVCGKLTEDDKQKGIDPYYVSIVSGEGSQTINLLYYAKQVYEKFLLREVILNSRKITESAMLNNNDVYELMNNAHNVIGQLIDVRPGMSFSIDKLLDDTMDSIENSSYTLIQTGFPGFDKLAGGMTRGELTILGGRPGHGKTTTMVNLVKACIDQGLKVIVFNREMTNVEMLKKLIVLESGKLSYLNVRKGYIGDIETMGELNEVKEEMANKYSPEKFAMFDNLKTFSESAAEVKKFKPDVIFDDYIQLISPEGHIKERRLQLEKLVNDYKWLVKSQNSVGVLLSQLNRGVEYRGDMKPRMSDLAESGAIEQVAENVMFVFYEHKVKMSKDGENIIELIGSKVRYGVSGSSKLGYWGDRVKLYPTIEECIKARRGK